MTVAHIAARLRLTEKDVRRALQRLAIYKPGRNSPYATIHGVEVYRETTVQRIIEWAEKYGKARKL